MLNLLHEGLKHKGQDIPRVDLLGEEALNKGLSYFGKAIGNEEKLYQATLAGDVIGNTFYYSLIGAGGIAYIWPRAVFYGLSAGIGAIKLPRPMGFDSSPVTKSNKTKS